MTVIAAPSQTLFDDIKHTRPDGTEYWSARELMPLMGYARWENFEVPLNRAQASARAQGHDVDTHFLRSQEKTSGRPRTNFELTRFAAYLVAMNGDPNMPEVAAAQSYFAIRTREAEIRPAPAELTGADLLARAVIEAQSMLAEKDRVIEAQKPKVEYVDQFVRNDDGVILRVAAQQLDIRERDLRQWLVDHRWIYRKVMAIRFDKKYQVEREEAEYFPCAGKGQYFKLVPQHEVPRYRSGALRHTLNITAPGMTRLAAHLAKEPAL